MGLFKSNKKQQLLLEPEEDNLFQEIQDKFIDLKITFSAYGG